MTTITSGATPKSRVHITNPRDWGVAIGTDYWANFQDLTIVEGDSQDLDLYGWVETGTCVTAAGSGADLLSSADVGTPGGLHVDTAGDAITSPFIFGDYAHARACEGILGYTPTTMTMECYARFSADPGDDEDTGFGFIEAGAASPFVKAGLMALITSDGTNYSLESAAAAASGSADGGATQLPHLWKIEMAAGAAIKWYIDGTLQANTLALQTDLFPVAWGASVGAGGVGDPVICWVHIWYS
jgi:hypothetical protein